MFEWYSKSNCDIALSISTGDTLQNLPPGHCGTRVKAAEVVSEPTCQLLWDRGAGCLSGVGTYLLDTV